MKDLIDFLLFWLTISIKYDKIKQSPNADTSIKMGVSSLVMSIMGFIATVALGVLAFVCFTAGGAVVLMWILGIICALSAIVCYVYLVLASIIYAGYQMRLNKRRVGVAALAVSIINTVVTLIAVAVIVFVFII